MSSSLSQVYGTVIFEGSFFIEVSCNLFIFLYNRTRGTTKLKSKCTIKLYPCRET